ncbi:MAG: glutamate--tRNA ligase, partial [Firmicutes bacterium]|nr:glutamate--tRNA ligase [Bacillota bacterium]
PKKDREKFTLEEMVQLFSVDGLSKSASIFDEVKLKWLNGQYIKEMSPEAFYDYAQRFFDKYEFLKCYDRKLICSLLQNRIEIFDDIGPAMEFLTKFDGYDLNLLCNQKWKTDLNTAKEMLPVLIGLTEKNFDCLHDALVAFGEQNGYKKGQVLWIFRIAITGAQSTPGGATEMAELLGKEETIRRLKESLARVNA